MAAAAADSTPGRLDATSCSVQSVTVYNDRAEVTRLLKTRVTKGTQDIVIFGLSPEIQPNSIRVSGGTGNATILEVSYAVKFEKKEETNLAKVEEQQKQLKELREQQQKLQDERTLLDKSRSFIDDYASRLLASPDANAADLLSEQSLKGVEQFLKFYQDQLTELDEQRNKLDETTEELDQRIRNLEREIGQRNPTNSDESREVTIAVDAPEEGPLSLNLSYVVLKAGWEPSYDLRATSNSTTLQLTYHGIIRQSTGENWEKAKIALSTAKPSYGGAPPTLPLQKVSFRATYYESKKRNMAFGRSYAMSSPSSSTSASAPGGAPEIDVMTATAEQGVTSTTFHIPREATIHSDNKPHKVAIAVIELAKSRFSYEAVPKATARAFLKATTTNTSEYPLLAGPVHIFFDNNFIASSALHQNVSPNEEFDSYLGVDPYVRVDYKPVRKFRETSGVFAKVQTLRFQQETVVKNTRDSEISIKVVDQVPKSGSGQIKIKLLEPEIKTEKEREKSGEKDDGTRHDEAAGNVEWNFKIAANKEVSLKVVYEVEWPRNEEVEGW